MHVLDGPKYNINALEECSICPYAGILAPADFIRLYA
jgi:hypothetical protein